MPTRLKGKPLDFIRYAGAAECVYLFRDEDISGSTLSDLSGNSVSLTIGGTAGTETTDNIHGPCFRGDGTNGASVDPPAAFDSVTDYTVFLIVKVEDNINGSGGTEDIFELRDDTSSQDSVSLGWLTSENLLCRLEDDSDSNNLQETDGFLNDAGKWAYIAITCDGSTGDIAMYKCFDGETTVATTTAGSTTNGTTGFNDVLEIAASWHGLVEYVSFEAVNINQTEFETWMVNPYQDFEFNESVLNAGYALRDNVILATDFNDASYGNVHEIVNDTHTAALQTSASRITSDTYRDGISSTGNNSTRGINYGDYNFGSISAFSLVFINLNDEGENLTSGTYARKAGSNPDTLLIDWAGSELLNFRLQDGSSTEYSMNIGVLKTGTSTVDPQDPHVIALCWDGSTLYGYATDGTNTLTNSTAASFTPLTDTAHDFIVHYEYEGDLFRVYAFDTALTQSQVESLASEFDAPIQRQGETYDDIALGWYSSVAPAVTGKTFNNFTGSTTSVGGTTLSSDLNGYHGGAATGISVTIASNDTDNTLTTSTNGRSSGYSDVIQALNAQGAYADAGAGGSAYIEFVFTFPSDVTSASFYVCLCTTFTLQNNLHIALNGTDLTSSFDSSGNTTGDVFSIDNVAPDGSNQITIRVYDDDSSGSDGRYIFLNGIYVHNIYSTTGTTVTLSADVLAITEGTLTVEEGVDVDLTGDTLSITEGSLTVAAGGVTVTLASDTLVITEGALTVEEGVDVTLASDTLAITEGTVSVEAGVAVSLTSETLSIATGTLSIGVGADVTLNADSLSISEGTLSVDVGTNVSLTSDTLLVTEGTISVDVGTGVSLTPDALSISAGTLSVSVGAGVNPTPDTLVISAGSLTVEVGVDVTVAGDSLALSPGSLTVEEGVDVTVSGDSLSISAGALQVEQATDITLTGDALIISEGTLNVQAGAGVTPSAASLIITGGTLAVEAGLNIGLTSDALIVSGGTLSVDTGIDVDITGETLAISAGTLDVEVGVDVNVTPDTLVVSEGSLSITSTIAVSLTPATITLSEGSLTIETVADVDLSAASLSITPGTLNVSLASLISDRNTFQMTLDRNNRPLNYSPKKYRMD